MRAALIILLWILLGVFFWWTKTDCCSDKALPSASSKIEEGDKRVTYNADSITNQLSNLRFEKSSVLMNSGNNIDSLLSEVTKALAQGKGVTITGFAFDDEDSPSELGLLRAKEIKSLLNVPGSLIKLRSEVISESYSEAKGFLTYEVIDNPEGEEKSVDENSILIQEDKTSYLYIGQVSPDQEIPSIVKNHLKSIAKRLDGNFCKITIVSYSDDRKNAYRWQSYVEDHLIKYGIIPSRINSRIRKLGDRERATMELIITE